MAFFVGIATDSGRQGSKKVSPESRTDFDKFADEELVLSFGTESWLFLSSWVWFIMWTRKPRAVFPSPPSFWVTLFFQLLFWGFYWLLYMSCVGMWGVVELQRSLSWSKKWITCRRRSWTWSRWKKLIQCRKTKRSTTQTSPPHQGQLVVDSAPRIWR